MNAYRVAVCDNEIILAQAISRYVQKYFNKYKSPEIEIVSNIFSRAEDLLKIHEHIPFDVAFLDIDMPGINGFDAADLLRARHPGIEILFVTCHTELMQTSIKDYKAFWFITKGKWDDLEQAVIKLMAGETKAYNKTEKLEIYEDVENPENVCNYMYFEADRNCVIAHKVGGEVEKEYMALSNVVDKKQLINCFRISRKYVVNFYYVQKIVGRTIYLFDGTELPISRSKENDIKARFFSYSTDPTIALSSLVYSPYSNFKKVCDFIDREPPKEFSEK